MNAQQKDGIPLKQRALGFPEKPGVYVMKNREGEIIYIGKAVNLKKRVSSYFSGKKDIKTRFLLEKINTIEHIVTKSEYEALLLENNLIKQWAPHYNINLKDGKTYPVIRITNEDFPRVFRTRRIIDDGSLYFGPYTDVKSIDLYLELIEKVFYIRKCKGPLKKRANPCLYYHIHRCGAPCCGKVSKEEYAEIVEQVKRLLSGNDKSIRQEMKQKMETAAEHLDFERAALYRDSLHAVEEAGQSQKVVDFIENDRDYIACAVKEHLCTFVVFQMRNGKLTGQDIFRTEIFETEEEGFTHFLLQYYSPARVPPGTVYISHLPDSAEVERYFNSELKMKSDLKVPLRGKHKSLLAMVEENARIDVVKRFDHRDNPALLELKNILDLPDIPRRIEGFDIAQLAGTNPVASMVSFLNGRPDKKEYRKFHIKSLGGQIDDFKAVREAVARRYTRILNEGGELPDLILIDGGKGQVSSAYAVLKALGIADIPLIGLAKRIEELVPVGGEPFTLPDNAPALRLLQHVRDESHRFATTFQKMLRTKDVETSLLEKVPGIGKKRAAVLLQEFGTLEMIKNAGAGQISSKVKINRETARGLIEFLEKNFKPRG